MISPLMFLYYDGIQNIITLMFGAIFPSCLLLLNTKWHQNDHNIRRYVYVYTDGKDVDNTETGKEAGARLKCWHMSAEI